MGVYRARDLWLVPSLISLTRLPLALSFVLVVARPLWALAVLVAAAATDVLDGWYARRFGQATPAGAVVDGLSDKVFAGAVVAALVAHGWLTWPQAWLLALREVGELPLVLWWAVFRHRRQRRADNPRANAVGKLATIAQFFAVGAALFGSPTLNATLYATAAIGAVAALSYWRRELHG